MGEFNWWNHPRSGRLSDSFDFILFFPVSYWLHRNVVKQSNMNLRSFFSFFNKLERLIWLDNHWLTLNQSREEKIGWMLMGIFRGKKTEVNWGNQSHWIKKLNKKWNEMKRQNKMKRYKRLKHVHNMTRQHVMKVTYNLDSIRFIFFRYQKNSQVFFLHQV